jgi:hypothetical protein
MSTKANRPLHTLPPLAMSPVVIREASDADRPALRRLAQRDSREVPAGGLLVAELDGELRAAVAVETGHAIADPFRPTAELVDLLRARAAQISAGRRRPLRILARTATPSSRAAIERAAA